MIIGLTAKNKLSFVDGTTSKPPLNSTDSKCWERCNNMVIGWLIASLDRVIAKRIMYYNSAQDIWSDLEERFGKSSSAQLYSLQEALTKLTQSPSMSIADYFTRVKSLWDEIDHLDPVRMCSCNTCSCGLVKKFLKSQQDQRLIQFLMRLDDQYSQARTNILMMSELPTIQAAYRLLVQEERHREICKATAPTESLAFLSDKRKVCEPSRNNDNYNSSKRLYTQSNGGGKRTNNYFCEHCKIKGHSIQRFFKIHSYPDSRGRKIAANTQSDHADLLTNVGGTRLTSEQLNNLLSLLNKNESHVDMKTDGLESDANTLINVGTLAGPFQEKSLSTW